MKQNSSDTNSAEDRSPCTSTRRSHGSRGSASSQWRVKILLTSTFVRNASVTRSHPLVTAWTFRNKNVGQRTVLAVHESNPRWRCWQPQPRGWLVPLKLSNFRKHTSCQSMCLDKECRCKSTRKISQKWRCTSSISTNRLCLEANWSQVSKWSTIIGNGTNALPQIFRTFQTEDLFFFSENVLFGCSEHWMPDVSLEWNTAASLCAQYVRKHFSFTEPRFQIASWKFDGWHQEMCWQRQRHSVGKISWIPKTTRWKWTSGWTTVKGTQRCIPPARSIVFQCQNPTSTHWEDPKEVGCARITSPNAQSEEIHTIYCRQKLSAWQSSQVKQRARRSILFRIEASNDNLLQLPHEPGWPLCVNSSFSWLHAGKMGKYFFVLRDNFTIGEHMKWFTLWNTAFRLCKAMMSRTENSSSEDHVDPCWLEKTRVASNLGVTSTAEWFSFRWELKTRRRMHLVITNAGSVVLSQFFHPHGAAKVTFFNSSLQKASKLDSPWCPEITQRNSSWTIRLLVPIIGGFPSLTTRNHHQPHRTDATTVSLDQ